MKMREFNESEAELIAETTNSTMNAASHIIRGIFSHYVVKHAEDEDEVEAITRFYEHVQDELATTPTLTGEKVQREAKEFMAIFNELKTASEDEEEKAKK